MPSLVSSKAVLPPRAKLLFERENAVDEDGDVTMTPAKKITKGKTTERKAARS